MPNNNPFAENAHKYINNGYSVILVKYAEKRPVIKIMGHFDVYPIFIATFVPRRETLTATHSRT